MFSVECLVFRVERRIFYFSLKFRKLHLKGFEGKFKGSDRFAWKLKGQMLLHVMSFMEFSEVGLLSFSLPFYSFPFSSTQLAKVESFIRCKS